MTFREGLMNHSDDHRMPEEDFNNRTEYLGPNQRPRSNKRGPPLKQHFKWLQKTISRVKSWLLNLGKGYFYALFGIFMVSLLPVLVVRGSESVF